jgi:serine/threonine protein kinase
MSTCPSEARLRQLLADQLSGPDGTDLETHLETCGSCRQTLEILLATDLDLRAVPQALAERQDDVPREVLEDLKKFVPPVDLRPLSLRRVAGRLPAVPGYEVLEELGHGSMGVVYKARHVGLKRLVALKMVLSTGHAWAERLSRFRTEAEAVARLQHPHIVQIYDVGEHEGLPFCALEFCSDGTLATALGGRTLRSGEAARLVERLADAVHHAHQCGVIHRDLKPENVLLARQAGLAAEEAPPDAQSPLAGLVPKISDFGLAHYLDATARRTEDGVVLGTPSYMAPEQAQGRSGRLGPAVDVYALGAILYELLTGRPPFHTGSPLETLRQVLDDEPIPPSQLRAQVAPDLERICLRCLQKGPAQRYASAAVLCHDLRLYLAGKPVPGSPPSRRQRLGRWCCRHPVLLAAALLLVLTGTVAGLVRLLAPAPAPDPAAPFVARPRPTPEKAAAIAQGDRKADKKEAPPPVSEHLPPGWTEYRFPVGKARVWLPGVPKESTQTVATKSGDVANHLANLTDAETGLHFSVSCSELRIIPVEPLAVRLNAARDGALRKIEGKAIREKDLHLGDRQGREVYVEAPQLGKGVLRMHLYVVGQRLYQLMAFGARDAVDSRAAERFFGSFRLAAER